MARIRRAAPSDLAALEALYLHLHPDRPTLPRETSQAIFDQMLSLPTYHLLVCAEGEKLVASCTLVLSPNLMRGGRPFGLIENVVTHADYRRQGHGKALIREAFGIAWKANAYNVLLMTGRDDPGVHRFYENCGFKSGVKTGYVARAPDLE